MFQTILISEIASTLRDFGDCFGFNPVMHLLDSFLWPKELRAVHTKMDQLLEPQKVEAEVSCGHLNSCCLEMSLWALQEPLKYSP